MKLTVAIGTNNQAKINAVKEAFSHIPSDFSNHDVDSGVSSQPFSDSETIEGAINRAKGALKLGATSIGIGLEGGVVQTEYGLFLCNWGALVDIEGEPIIAGGARIKLPEEIAENLKQGKELGEVMVAFTNLKNIRQKEGAIGIFSNGYVSRTEMFLHVSKLLVGQYTYKRMND